MSAWDRIAATLVSEFSDVADLETVVRVVLRLLLAALLGGLLGLQREQHGKEAGVRTHMLVALGAALFVLVPLEAGSGVADTSRVIQGVIAGVGFLCAGTILRITGEDQVRGLTTAAGIWLTAAIGIAVGWGAKPPRC
jgi:putative Mg2+ transporter-C (MgtC) family protein